jgi:hypothetical protein
MFALVARMSQDRVLMACTTPSEYMRPINAKKDGSDGYWYFRDPDHPLANSHDRVRLARHILSVHENLWLEPTELVVYLDGNRDNLDPENLAIRVQAEADRSKNRLVETAEPLRCAFCGKEYHERPSHAHLRQYCSRSCQAQASRRFNPTAAELYRDVWSMPTVDVAAKYGVSDKAIEKRCKRLGLEKPWRGYWAQVAAGVMRPREVD